MNAPVIERHAGIDVVREDYCDPELPSGKLRGVIPWFQELRAGGIRTVVNYGASYSNSHGIVSYAAMRTGLKAITYVCCRKPTPQTELAERYGGQVVYAGPMHLSPLGVYARKHTEPEDSVFPLPWGLGHPRPLEIISKLVDPLDWRDVHVVPIGAGGYAHAVATGCRRNKERWGRRPRVIGVPSTGTLATNYRRFNRLRPPISIDILERRGQLEPPFPCDPHYEWWAWPEALRFRDEGLSVLFWSVGVPLC